MLKWLAYPCYCLICFFCVYKYIRHIDKKERKKLKQWENEYINAYKDIWKEQYFLKLAEEKQIKQYEAIQKKNNEESKEKLKQVKISDLDSFEHDFVQNLNAANEKIEKEKSKHV